jgi:hypothetical protein
MEVANLPGGKSRKENFTGLGPRRRFVAIIYWLDILVLWCLSVLVGDDMACIVCQCLGKLDL